MGSWQVIHAQGFGDATKASDSGIHGRGRKRNGSIYIRRRNRIGAKTNLTPSVGSMKPVNAAGLSVISLKLPR